LASVLAASAAAVAAGARSVTAIAEWATDAPGPILAALGVRRDPLTRRCQVPGEATIRRVLARVDGDAVDATIGAWLADRLPATPPPRPRGRRQEGAGLGPPGAPVGCAADRKMTSGKVGGSQPLAG
jgi:hypothetical protein